MKKFISIFVMALLCAFCLVACEDNKKPDPNEEEPAVEPGEDLPTELANAKSYIKQMYENAPTVTASDYQRVASYKNITLAWSVNVSDDKVKVIIEEGKTSTKKVGLGSTVTIKFVDNGKEVSYMIVGTVESDPVNGKISNSCPLGEALVGKTVGDIVEVKAIKTYKVEIVKIEIK